LNPIDVNSFAKPVVSGEFLLTQTKASETPSCSAMSNSATSDTLHNGKGDCDVKNNCFDGCTIKALQREADCDSVGVTDAPKRVTSASWTLRVFNTESVNAEDSTASSASEGCLVVPDRRNPRDVSFEATSGTVLVFAREPETIHGHTVILILLIQKSRHVQLICANAAISREGFW